MIPLHESNITTKQFLVVAAWKQVCGDLILIRLIKQRRTYMSSVYIFLLSMVRTLRVGSSYSVVSLYHITKYAYNRTILVRVNHLSIRMSNSGLIRILNAELKENLILRQKYYHNTSPNIDNEINSIILLNGHVSEKYNMSTKVFLTSFNFKYNFIINIR
jgi:uncharacterized protein YnzC (UPF0291/DUF896 family)